MTNALYSYSRTSQGAKAVARGLGLQMYHSGNLPRERLQTLINWGSTGSISGLARKIINDPGSVHNASNKVRTFRLLSAAGLSTPFYTQDQATAQGWARNGNLIVVRHEVSSSEGRGIELVRPSGRAIVPHAPLYTMHINQEAEYRAHVVGNKTIRVVQKIRNRNEEAIGRYRRADPQYRDLIQSWRNGYVFVRAYSPNQKFETLAVKAVKTLGLDFGAVDIGQRGNEFFVFEVNTAPGVEGSTIDAYVNNLHTLL